MRCPGCKAKSGVVDSRDDLTSGSYVWRRRRCRRCGLMVESEETVIPGTATYKRQPHSPRAIRKNLPVLQIPQTKSVRR